MDKPDQESGLPPSKQPQSRLVLQPSKKLLKDIAANPDDYKSPAAHVSPVSTESDSSIDLLLSDHSNDHTLPRSKADPVREPEPAVDFANDFSFGNGYGIGTGIFWFQFIAVIALALVFNGVIAVLQPNSVVQLLVITSVYYLLGAFIVAFLIPYRRLVVNEVEGAGWLAIFGIIFESVITSVVTTGLFLLATLFVHPNVILNIYFSLFTLGATGSMAVTGLVLLVFFTMLFFLVKISWGLALLIYGKIPRVVAIVIDIAVITLSIGGVAYSYLTMH